jgi:hypothetical protein
MPNRIYKRSDEYRQKLSEAKKGEKHPNYGKHHSEETKKKMSEAKLGKTLSEEHKIKIGNSNRGKHCSEETKKKISDTKLEKPLSEETRKRMSEFQKGKTFSAEYRKKLSEAKLGKKGEKSSGWKGGVTKDNIPLYDTFAHQLVPVEEVRRDPNNTEILQVKCTYCGEWINPTRDQVRGRILSINGKNSGESRFYHPGTKCRSQCSIFNTHTRPKGYKPATSREVQPELRQLVFKRDNYTCQKCDKSINEVSLHCHHYEGILINPLESADVDACITLCKECHKFVHTLPDCSYSDMRCK